MDDLVVGKLSWRVSGKDRQRVIICPSKKGNPTQFPIAFDELSAELIETESDEIEVEALRDGSGRPVLKVRPAGEEFKPHANVGKTEKQNSKVKKMSNQFHNPYSFVPAPPRENIEGELGDRLPSGHDCYHSQFFSGELRASLTVETPLLIPDTARLTEHKCGPEPDQIHRSFPLRIGQDGKPLLAVTSVKGMLRSAYESITNSRFSIFKEHEKRLAFRAAADEGISVVPARITENVLGQKCVELYTGESKVSDDGSPVLGDAMYAGWIRKYKWHKNPPAKLSGHHGQEVWAFVTLWEHKKFKFWNVVEIEQHTRPQPTAPVAENRVPQWQRTNKAGKPIPDSKGGFKKDVWRSLKTPHSPNPTGHWVEGFICITNENIERKHDERLFFKPIGSTPDCFILDENQWQTLSTEWKALINDYVATDHSGVKTELSRHIKKEERDLKPATLCYARIVKNNSSAHKRLLKSQPSLQTFGEMTKNGQKWLLLELNPVMISRRMHRFPPADLLSSELHPANARTQLSPADRVFGWVKQEGKGKGRAYRGQLRIGTIECKESDITFLNTDANLEDKHLGLPLAILGAPKPQQGRFYVSKNRFGEAQDPGLTNEQAGYNDERKGLRGRKVYPHHANLPDDYWQTPTKTNLETLKKDQGFYKEYRRRRAQVDGGPLKEQRDTQNRSVQAWVEKGTFEFAIHFINLSDVELGALLWLLTLNQESNKDVNGHVRYFRLGGGKPLGFGSIRLDLTGFEIRDGAAWREYYGGLADDDITFGSRHFISRHVSEGETSPEFIDVEQGLEQLIQKYKEAVKSAYKGSEFEKVSFIAAFLRAATGFVKKDSDEAVAIHYPRCSRYRFINQQEVDADDPKPFDPSATVPPHPEGLAYEWFVENNRSGARYALSDLNKDEGLPILKHKVN